MEPKYIEVRFGDKVYGVTVSGDGKRFGVCAGGVGRVKYMPVVFIWDSEAFVLPVLHKTRLSMAGTALDLYDSIYTCFRSQLRLQECVNLCEHVLKYGKTPR